MAYIVADDLADAKRKVEKLVLACNRKYGTSVRFENLRGTARAGLFYYELRKDKVLIDRDKARGHAQRFVKWEGGRK